MKIPGLYSLQSRFILGLITVIMVISIINLSALYVFMQNTMQGEVSKQAAIVLEQVDAVKDYVVSTLRPKMFDVLPENFILEAMSSSFISRKVMEKIGDASRDYRFRRVAIGASNPEFEADLTEREIIDYFRENRNETVWQGKKEIDGTELFVMARPVVYTADCLLCHGDPAEAPEAMSALYATTGYHHDENSIDGIDLVGIDTHHHLAANNERFLLYAVIYLTICGLVMFLIYLTFQRVVVVNLRTLTGQFRVNFRDQEVVKLIEQVERGDEITEMIKGMEGLSHHLYETEQQLKRHTANLEKEVARRTEQLSQENDRRRRDFILFVDILQALKTSRNRGELWQLVLPLLADSLQLEKASYICTFSSNQSFTWPSDRDRPSLPDDYVSLLVDPRVRITGNEAYIPIGASDEDIEGLLHLVRQEGLPFGDEDVEQLAAVGRQLGIAAENISVLAAILRQTDNLQTIFEGVTDPLILMEQGGAIIMANSAATRLLETLAGAEGGTPANLLALLLERPDGERDQTAVPTSETNSREVTLENGRSFVVSTFPLLREESRADRLVVAIQESTERKRMVQQMVQSEKMATVGKLAAGLAHEINNPLGVILCYAELLLKGVKDEQQRADVEVVIKHTRQAQSVLLDLLNFARPKVTTARETILGDVIESVIAVFQVQATKKQVTLTCRREDGNRPVHIEQQAAEHIILNLLINALDAITGPGGRIEVRLTHDARKDLVVLTVEDSGTGIATDVLPNIFDPFFTTKDTHAGTGLGLAIIYGYMYELGGSIEAEASSLGGARFTLVFPVAGR